MARSSSISVSGDLDRLRGRSRPDENPLAPEGAGEGAGETSSVDLEPLTLGVAAGRIGYLSGSPGTCKLSCPGRRYCRQPVKMANLLRERISYPQSEEANEEATLSALRCSLMKCLAIISLLDAIYTPPRRRIIRRIDT